jgi:uroporphyrinogen III methyltransferase/synthase
LKGRTILITRARGQEGDLRERLEALGARVIHVPTIEIAPPEDWTAVDDAITRFGDYHWLILTSENAAAEFLGRAGEGARAGQVKIAVVGSQTARCLEKHGLEADLIPAHYRAEGLLDVFPLDMRGVKILFPRADVAAERLPATLRDRGAEVNVVTVYRTIVPEEGGEHLRALLDGREVDCVVLTSGSTVRNLITMLDRPDAVELLSTVAVAVIGPMTWEVAKEAGLEVAIEPPTAKMSVLVEAIRQHYA